MKQMHIATAFVGIGVLITSMGIGYLLGTAPRDVVKLLPLACLGLVFGFWFGFVASAGTFQRY